MPRIEFLDPTQNGRPAEHLETKLRQLSDQIHYGDCIRVSHDAGSTALIFGREPEATRVREVAGRAA